MTRNVHNKQPKVHSNATEASSTHWQNWNEMVRRLTRSSAITEGPRDAQCPLKSFQLLHSCAKNTHLKRACNRWMALKVTQGHRNCRYSIGHISLPISGLQLLQWLHLTPFPRYYHIYIVRDWLWPWEVLQFKKTVEITNCVHSDSCVVYLGLHGIKRSTKSNSIWYDTERYDAIR